MSENEKKVPYKYRLINDSLESYNKTVDVYVNLYS